jgi:hypothetical protein
MAGAGQPEARPESQFYRTLWRKCLKPHGILAMPCLGISGRPRQCGPSCCWSGGLLIGSEAPLSRFLEHRIYSRKPLRSFRSDAANRRKKASRPPALAVPMFFLHPARECPAPVRPADVLRRSPCAGRSSPAAGLARRLLRIPAPFRWRSAGLQQVLEVL